jgi:hypothetical protein
VTDADKAGTGEGATSKAHRPSMVRTVVAAALGIAALVLSMRDSRHTDHDSFTLQGLVVLADSPSSTPDGNSTDRCTGTGRYAHIRKGATVTVYDAAGKAVGSGTLGQGRYGVDDYGSCGFSVAVSDIPGGKRSYRLEVTPHRKTSAFREEQARKGWFFVIVEDPGGIHFRSWE